MAGIPYTVTRSLEVAAPAAKIFPELNDLHRWQAWSPWEDLDPAMQRSYSGPEEGVGAMYSWSGNRKAGAGTMEIIESVPNERVDIRITFTKPFASVTVTHLTLEPGTNGSTRVVWAMDGEYTGFMKIGRFFLKMDTMIGKDFERGLERLRRTVTEQAA